MPPDITELNTFHNVVFLAAAPTSPLDPIIFTCATAVCPYVGLTVVFVKM